MARTPQSHPIRATQSRKGDGACSSHSRRCQEGGRHGLDGEMKMIHTVAIPTVSAGPGVRLVTQALWRNADTQGAADPPSAPHTARLTSHLLRGDVGEGEDGQAGQGSWEAMRLAAMRQRQMTAALLL